MQLKYRLRFVASILVMLVAVFASLSPTSVFANTPESLAPLLERLTQVSLKQTADLLDEMAETGEPELVELFEVMLDGHLHYEKTSRSLVAITTTPNKTYVVEPMFQPQISVEEVSTKSAYKKIRVNNRLRSKLRGLIASLLLNSDDVSKRRDAATEMIGNDTADIRAQLQQRLTVETDSTVIEPLTLAIAVYDLKQSDEFEIKLSAIKELDGSLHPEARNALNSVVESENEINTVLVARAEQALKSIDQKVRFYGLVEQLFFGLSLGSVLLLAAIGLSITFGVMGVINMAHGEMIMLGAYTTYVIQLLLPDHIGMSILIAIPAAFCVSGLVGILIERGVIQFLKGRPLETLLATFGISLILQQLVRSIFSPLNRQVITPDWLSGSLVINEVFSITYNRLYILIFALMVFVALQMLLKLSKLGLNVRAVSQNRSMARAMGIRTERVDALTFGLGSGVAGIAGVALSQLTNVGPNLGQSYIIDSFMVVVFGGVGNLLGTLIGSFSLGIVNKFLEPTTGAVMANILILVFVILFIQRRPQGLFPQKGRAAND